MGTSSTFRRQTDREARNCWKEQQYRGAEEEENALRFMVIEVMSEKQGGLGQFSFNCVAKVSIKVFARLLRNTFIRD